MELEWIRSAYFAVEGDARRHDLNRNFMQSVSFNSSSKILQSSMKYSQTPPKSMNDPSEINYYPLTTFLAVLDGNVNHVSK